VHVAAEELGGHGQVQAVDMGIGCQGKRRQRKNRGEFRGLADFYLNAARFFKRSGGRSLIILAQGELFEPKK